MQKEREMEFGSERDGVEVRFQCRRLSQDLSECTESLTWVFVVKFVRLMLSSPSQCSSLDASARLLKAASMELRRMFRIVRVTGSRSFRGSL